MRWAEAVKNFKQQQSTLCGDVLLITAFISYLGYFTKKYRQDLLDGIWKPYLHQLKVSFAFSEKYLLLELTCPSIVMFTGDPPDEGILQMMGMIPQMSPPSWTEEQDVVTLDLHLSVVSLLHANDLISSRVHRKILISNTNREPRAVVQLELGVRDGLEGGLEKGLLGAGRAPYQLSGRLGKTPDGSSC